MTNSNVNSINNNRCSNEDVWLGSVNSLLRMSLKGLRVCCPRCKKIGIPITKWVKGLKIKPLYVFHMNGHTVPDACLLNENEAEHVREHVRLNKDDIKTLVRSAEAYILFSGGADSLCTLDYINKIASGTRRKITAIHIDTTAGFPEVKRYVKKVCKELNVNLKILKPVSDYFTLAKRWGIPSHKSRWCCKELKIRPVRIFLRKTNNSKIIFDGIRAAESSIRAKYLPVWFHPSFKCLSASPIFHWSDKDILSYIEKRDLPLPPGHALGTSAECWCGAYKKKSDFENLYRLHPEIYHELAKVEKSNKYGFTFVYENGQKITLRDLEKEIRRKERV